jgi:FkbM family methyltransferase
MIRSIVFLVLVFSGSLYAESSPYVFQFEGKFEQFFQAGRYDLIARIIDADDVILEAGAFDGGDTLWLAQLVPKGKVISFEPNPPRYAELVEKTKNVCNVNTFPFALGETNNPITFYVCHGAICEPYYYEGASSALPPSESMKINYQGPKIEVPCFVLDDWCRENNQSEINFMWLDLEGYELQVLKSSPQILSTVKAMYVETNFYEFREGMTQYQDLRAFLEKTGFRLLSHGYYKGYQGNAIFVRANLFDEIVQRIESQP